MCCFSHFTFILFEFRNYILVLSSKDNLFEPRQNDHSILITYIMQTVDEHKLKGPSQPHLCFCLHVRIWLLYFIRSLSETTQDNLTYLQEDSLQ